MHYTHFVVLCHLQGILLYLVTVWISMYYSINLFNIIYHGNYTGVSLKEEAYKMRILIKSYCYNIQRSHTSYLAACLYTVTVYSSVLDSTHVK